YFVSTSYRLLSNCIDCTSSHTLYIFPQPPMSLVYLFTIHHTPIRCTTAHSLFDFLSEQFIVEKLDVNTIEELLFGSPCGLHSTCSDCLGSQCR
ncbi:hypothetical protein BLOT_002352, partial [Blomia tropicalis]